MPFSYHRIWHNNPLHAEEVLRMQDVEIKLTSEIRWPDCCAYCMGPKHHFVESKHSVISGVNPFFYTRTTVSIKHPVCQQHLFKGKFYSFLSNQSFVDLFVGMLLFSFFLLIPILFLPLAAIQNNSEIAFGLLCAAYLIAVTVLRANAPVKVIKPKDYKVTIRFANDAYASAFKIVNRT